MRRQPHPVPCSISTHHLAAINQPFTAAAAREATTFKTYAAVLEFTAEAGTAIVPAPMMSLLSCGEEDTLRFRSVTLPKADFVQVRLPSAGVAKLATNWIVRFGAVGC